MSVPAIVLVGGGFSGTVTAARLLRQTATPQRVVTVNRSGPSARGVVNRNGMPSKTLYYVGPLLRAKYWESMAVPELREHCARLALVLLEKVCGTRGPCSA